MITTAASIKIKERKPTGKRTTVLPDLYDSNPYTAIQNGKIMAKAWIKMVGKGVLSQQAQTFLVKTIESYWQKIQGEEGRLAMPYLFTKLTLEKLDESVLAVAEAIGSAAARLPILEASYEIGNVYTALLPETIRAAAGIFYTPPSLTKRLLAIAEEAGVQWATARVIDPACGGGAFLAPMCSKIVDALRDRQPAEILAHIQTHLVGWEIDPFAGWLTQVFVEVVVKDLEQKAGMRLKPLVMILDSLQALSRPIQDGFDLVIGNPPYGKLKLTEDIRQKYQRSLYGHPNYYGLFTHLAVTLVKEKGVIAFLTPTSFLSGEYFKNLRILLREEVIPVEIDFVAVRKGVFEDVLQETMLAVYRRDLPAGATVKVNQLTTTPGKPLHIITAGQFALSQELSAPWILPRKPEQSRPVQAMQGLPTRLHDWGYKVSTGPLVWNRHKKQLAKKDGKGRYPIVWAEAVTAEGRFILRAEKKNHQPYFTFKKEDEWLLTTKPCILLQRTTAKEQDKRLIAAALPCHLLGKNKAVVVENHLNMIIATMENPAVTPEVLATFLNSRATNEAFRAISGSVAVSAYELESLPLPRADQLKELQQLLINRGSQEAIESACLELYQLANV